jgi:hypothetical protein
MGYQVPVIRLYIGGTRTITVTINNYLTGSGTVTATNKIYLTGSGYGYRTGSCTYPVLKPRLRVRSTKLLLILFVDVKRLLYSSTRVHYKYKSGY